MFLVGLVLMASTLAPFALADLYPWLLNTSWFTITVNVYGIVASLMAIMIVGMSFL
jgi:uncharacterized membrane protein